MEKKYNRILETIHKEKTVVFKIKIKLAHKLYR
jgi:hypothetical protein